MTRGCWADERGIANPNYGNESVQDGDEDISECSAGAMDEI